LPNAAAKAGSESEERPFWAEKGEAGEVAEVLAGADVAAAAAEGGAAAASKVLR